ncbi:DMT family transporter [Xenorhabdus sp. 42]|uniref:DMT family transporter n=1 Tax=Xenorhabdus szentirmaii TaxID=290112 RepID=UPI001991D4A7|nr:DMT family transporter [Xenorhabdus sp. 42]MBD2821537.1 DMT family transporter [Xenorhabdus sp. 42]
MNKTKFSGMVYALLAAIFNGTVGVLSVKLFQSGVSPSQVAFYKCFIGLIIIFSIILLSPKRNDFLKLIRARWYIVLVCAFFGFFILYHFETHAYSTTDVSTVVFVLFGSATLFSFILSAIAEKRFFGFKEIQAMILSVIGLYLIFAENGNIDLTINAGLINALIAGLGYGLFLFLSKKLKLGAGFPQLGTLFLFGCLFLYIPVHGDVLNVTMTVEIFILLLLLAILPTIAGFWCTTKALTLTSSQSVQLIELSEPIFAIVFSVIFLGQLSSPIQYLGGALIFIAILLHEFPVSLQKIKSLFSSRSVK